MSVNELQLQTYKNAEHHFKKSDYRKAAKSYSELVPVLDKNNIWHIEMLGNYAICLKKLKKYELAEEVLIQQIEMYKAFYKDDAEVSAVIARIGLCEIYQEQKKFDEAIKILEPYADAYESSGHITHYYLAINQEKVGQPILAKRHAKLAIAAANNPNQEQHLENELAHLL